MSDMLIEIVDEGDVHPWHYRDPQTKRRYNSVFNLRVIPKEVENRLRKKHNRFEFVRGARVDDFQSADFVADVIDYAVQGWSGVTTNGREIPCTKETKVRLPEPIKAEIVRLCLGRELGMALAALRAEEDQTDTVNGEGGETARPTQASR